MVQIYNRCVKNIIIPKLTLICILCIQKEVITNFIIKPPYAGQYCFLHEMAVFYKFIFNGEIIMT